MFQQNNKIKHIKKIIFCAVFLNIVSGFNGMSIMAEELSFKQALEKMYTVNESLKASKSAVDKSR